MRRRLENFLAEHRKLSLAMLFSGTAMVITLTFLAAFAPYVTRYSPIEIGSTLLGPPNSDHILGTDALGRDIFSRVCYGGRASLSVAFVAMIISITVGSFLGAAGGYIGGKLDRVVAVFMDAAYAFPTYIMAFMIAIVLGPDAINLSFAVAIAGIPGYFRIVRSIALSIKERTFIEAEVIIGAPTKYIVIHHILPYAISSIIVLMSMGVADAILAISGLGFLGIGIQPPSPEWGTDLRWGREVLLNGQWWPTVFPSIAIFLAVFGFNMLGEGLSAIFREQAGGRFAAP